MAKETPSKVRKTNHAETAFDPVSAALQQLYQAVSSEEMPDDFLRILGEIDAKLAAAKSSHPQ